MGKTRSFNIPKQLVMQAYKFVKANAGAAGVDEQTLEAFDQKKEDNLYKLWARMSAGSYMPPPVRTVAIPKKSGEGVRKLGIPTVSDRIAQTVVKLVLEPVVEQHFLPDSYGYRPNKSAQDAIGVTRERCWKQDYVLEFDIKGLFDNIPHNKLMLAVKKHTQCRWVLLYIERWLKAPIQTEDGTLITRTSGTSQGSVVSPVLSNLYMHYVFDLWMKQKHPHIKWCRYADDGLMHCRSEQEAKHMLGKIKVRFAECGLEAHPIKTRIVYCKDSNRKKDDPNKAFDFLGYTFRGRAVGNNQTKQKFVSFTPAASKGAIKEMKARMRALKIARKTTCELKDIAKAVNPIFRGWINYYGKYHRSALYEVWRCFNKTLVKWVMRKYKRYHGKITRSVKLLDGIAKREPTLFAHWQAGMIGSFI